MTRCPDRELESTQPDERCELCIHGTRRIDATHRKCMVDDQPMPNRGKCGDFTEDG